MLSRLIKIPPVVLPRTNIFSDSEQLSVSVQTNGKPKLPMLELTKHGKKEAIKKTVVIRM